MSAGNTASVQLADPEAFNSMANDVRGMEASYTTTVVVNGTIIQGWKLVDPEPPFRRGQYRIVLRHPLNDEIGTAEYIGILLSDDGYEQTVCQYVLIQNDNDYLGSGPERFDVLWLTHHR